MDPFNCRGIIIKSNDYKEKDRLLSVLTSDRGLITICAKGVAKPGSSLGFVSMPYMLCDFVVSVSHGYYYLKDATIIESNSKIMESLEQMTVAAHIASCLDDCTLQSENAKEAYELAVYAFYMLANNKEKYLLIYSAFNWRLLTILGLTVEYVTCELTGAPVTRDGRYVLSPAGGSINESSAGMSGESVFALNYFAECDIKDLFAVKASENIINELKRFTTDYLSVQFDKEYNALATLDALNK
jgi:DNA repair protein RecO